MKRLQLRELHEQAVEEIGQGIVAGDFVPELPLPGEAELCGTLGVSRTVLREAMRVLAAKGLVEPKRKVGTTVRPIENWNFLDADILTLWSCLIR